MTKKTEKYSSFGRVSRLNLRIRFEIARELWFTAMETSILVNGAKETDKERESKFTLMEINTTASFSKGKSTPSLILSDFSLVLVLIVKDMEKESLNTQTGLISKGYSQKIMPMG